MSFLYRDFSSETLIKNYFLAEEDRKRLKLLRKERFEIEKDVPSYFQTLIVMASQASSVLPWAWVIEALASFKEVEPSDLADLVKSSPDISNDIGRNAREMASFRTLERLFDQETGTTKSVSSSLNTKVSFDFSKCCEDVLRHILGEMHGSNKWDESEKSKWDIQPFIAYKRSCMVRSDLQQLKNTVTGGRQPNQYGTRIYNCDGDAPSNQQLSPCDDDKVSVDTCQEVNEGKHQGDRSEEMRMLNGEPLNDMEHVSESESSSDHESESESSSDHGWYRKEMNFIATKRQVFLSSKCLSEEVSTHLKEANNCMKCDKGGELLTCSSGACSLVFHKSCLVSASTYDNDLMGKFYCPFCRYSRSISDYWIVKKKSSLARNDLVCFNSLATKHGPKKFRKRLHVSEQNVPRQDEDLHEMTENSKKRKGNNVMQNTQYRENIEDVEQRQPSAIYVNDDNDNDRSHGQERKTVTNRTDLAWVINNTKEKKAGPEGQTKGMDGKLTMLQPVHESHADSQILNGVSHLAVPDLPNETSESSSTAGQHEESSEEADYRDHSIRPRRAVKMLSPLHVSERRRVPVPWTQLEEETLKKGVQMFSSDRDMHHRGVPWKRILELGISVFQRSRTPVDLKDKWRNMCKANTNL